MHKFSNRRTIDLRDDYPSFRWKALSVPGNENIYLVYHDSGTIDNCTFNARGLVQSSPFPYVIIKEGDVYVSYEYSGDVLVERVVSNNIRMDIILNLDCILGDIERFMHEQIVHKMTNL